jgi:hypothetical protein
MSPPEVWGPAIWTLFHTLAEKINDNAYPYLINSMFTIIVKICKFLPCPECSRDASSFLARININNYKTKREFKNMLYLFHNWVNSKKRKPLFNYGYINKYANLNLINVVNNFISNYNTKGNMKLLAETFQRSFVIKDFVTWFRANIRAFWPIQQPQSIDIVNNELSSFTEDSNQIVTENPVIKAELVEEQVVTEEVKKEPIVEEQVVTEEVKKEPIVEEQVVTEEVKEEPIVEEQLITEEVKEEPIVEEQVVTEEVNEEPVAEEPVAEELVETVAEIVTDSSSKVVIEVISEYNCISRNNYY